MKRTHRDRLTWKRRWRDNNLQTGERKRKRQAFILRAHGEKCRRNGLKLQQKRFRCWKLLLEVLSWWSRDSGRWLQALSGWVRQHFLAWGREQPLTPRAFPFFCAVPVLMFPSSPSESWTKLLKKNPALPLFISISGSFPSAWNTRALNKGSFWVPTAINAAVPAVTSPGERLCWSCGLWCSAHQVQSEKTPRSAVLTPELLSPLGTGKGVSFCFGDFLKSL